MEGGGSDRWLHVSPSEHRSMCAPSRGVANVVNSLFPEWWTGGVPDEVMGSSAIALRIWF